MAEKESWVARQRRQRPWLDHLARAYEAFNNRYGNHYGAAITYFSVLSLFPLLMIAFAIVGFVLAGDPVALKNLKETVTGAVPSGLDKTINDLIDQAIESRSTVGVIGLLTAAYSGLGWMSNLRDALTAQWGIEHKDVPFLKRMRSDLLSLLGLGLALAVSFGLTAAGSGLGSLLLDWLGLEDDAWAVFLLRVATILLALAANWVVFIWVISRLPREKVSARSAVRGAIAAAIGFEILKQAATLFLAGVTSSPTGVVFGPIIGLLVFANLVARFLLFITAWTATAKENLLAAVPEPPPPAVIRPVMEVRGGPSARGAAGLVGAGALLGLLWRRRSR
ncbi:MAG TPA: inner membrane protein YhjD [Actinophytocola sp.]|nr:inner membrane protein YhjD [Actinophytocola sp.]